VTAERRVEDSGAEREPQSPAKSEIAIEAWGLGKSYDVYAHPQDRLKQMLWRGRRSFGREFVAVRNVELEVARGETVGIVGRNGSGKSTLLQLICGTLEPTTGTLHVRGHVAPILTLGAGFNPEFTGRENVLMNAALLGLTKAEVEEHLDAIIAFADIGEFFDQPVKTFSSGMHARLAFSVAIHAHPDILVIDEILAVGDEAFNRKCFSRIERLKQNGSTILFVSHSAGLVVELCDRAILMESGERLLTGDPKSVIGCYHRLLYTPPAQLPAVRQEIRELDRLGDEVSASDAGATGAVDHLALPDGDDFGHFDPGLRPESTVEYPRKGATIVDPRILAPDGRQVNVLRAGQEYIYAYEVEFSEPAWDVRFGMMIKLVSGFELGGQASHPRRKGVPLVAAGATARVRFQFSTKLVPGAYFLNAGVLGTREGGQAYLHRVLDAVMFRIDPQGADTITGSVDLTADAAAEILIDGEDAAAGTPSQ